MLKGKNMNLGLFGCCLLHRWPWIARVPHAACCWQVGILSHLHLHDHHSSSSASLSWYMADRMSHPLIFITDFDFSRFSTSFTFFYNCSIVQPLRSTSDFPTHQSGLLSYFCTIFIRPNFCQCLLFLSDPGIPGVRSMDPSLCHSLREVVQTLQVMQVMQAMQVMQVMQVMQILQIYR